MLRAPGEARNTATGKFVRVPLTTELLSTRLKKRMAGKPEIPAGLPSRMPIVLTRLPTEESNVTIEGDGFDPILSEAHFIEQIGSEGMGPVDASGIDPIYALERIAQQRLAVGLRIVFSQLFGYRALM